MDLILFFPDKVISVMITWYKKRKKCSKMQLMSSRNLNTGDNITRRSYLFGNY